MFKEDSLQDCWGYNRFRPSSESRTYIWKMSGDKEKKRLSQNITKNHWLYGDVLLHTNLQPTKSGVIFKQISLRSELQYQRTPWDVNCLKTLWLLLRNIWCNIFELWYLMIPEQLVMLFHHFSIWHTEWENWSLTLLDDSYPSACHYSRAFWAVTFNLG